mmetsp:Transcript_7663/g.21317  ORF Transcript_7663/g.21317 Transcript_7663/m.21317 type:complete len:113 (-) Transcript_7663:2266-2604(-)
MNTKITASNASKTEDSFAPNRMILEVSKRFATVPKWSRIFLTAITPPHVNSKLAIGTTILVLTNMMVSAIPQGLALLDLTVMTAKSVQPFDLTAAMLALAQVVFGVGPMLCA